MRRVVVLLGSPTKRLSRLSALFRMSVLCANGGRAAGDLRYTNPNEQAGRHLPAHPVVTDELAQTVLAESSQQQLSVLSDTLSSDSDQYERVTEDSLRKAGLPHRTLRTSELVVETQLAEGGHQGKSHPAGREQVQPSGAFSDCGMKAHHVTSADPIYDVVAKSALPARAAPPPTGSEASWDLVLAEDDITIVENDHYAETPVNITRAASGGLISESGVVSK